MRTASNAHSGNALIATDTNDHPANAAVSNDKGHVELAVDRARQFVLALDAMRYDDPTTGR